MTFEKKLKIFLNIEIPNTLCSLYLQNTSRTSISQNISVSEFGTFDARAWEETYKFGKLKEINTEMFVCWLLKVNWNFKNYFLSCHQYGLKWFELLNMKRLLISRIQSKLIRIGNENINSKAKKFGYADPGWLVINKVKRTSTNKTVDFKAIDKHKNDA